MSSSNFSTISTSSRAGYEVFLSFRGPDTRRGFADCLYTRLTGAGIDVFRDDPDLRPGEKINDALVESIKLAKILIPIISIDYSSSGSCLMELAQMLECKKEDNVMPIFYYTDPKDVKYGLGSVAKSFCKHEEHGISGKDIAKWKQAFKEIAGIKGYHLSDTNNRYHGELIEKVLSDVLQFLKKNDLLVTDKLVGIEPHVQEVMRALGIIYFNEQAAEVCDKDVRVLGICGMPGIGKTTLAKFVYNKIHHLFQGCSFLHEIPKKDDLNGLVRLQNRLISDLRKQEYRRLSTPDEGTKVIANSFKNMRVLIFIDGVREYDQIQHIVGELSWFGPGTRILMTAGSKEVLNHYSSEVAHEYVVSPMEDYQALQLFRKHAFNKCSLEEQREYASLVIKIVDTIKGLPLAIKVTASFLRKKELPVWKDTLERLRRKPKEEVKEALNIGYGYLNEETKNIFLDIACFFIGMDERIPKHMWHACQYYPAVGIKILCDMCFVEVGENFELWMHNQIREFGREIVRSENRWPWKRSRLWNHTDALSTLKRKESAENVEALALTFDKGKSECFTREGFGHLCSLRFLRLDHATIGGSFQSGLSALRWLDWQGCSEISELLVLDLENLVILDLSRSSITGNSQLWGQILEKANELEVLRLSNCRYLFKSPDFHASILLKRLVLEHCSLLAQIGRSVGNLKNLVSLNLNFCKWVKHLPDELRDMKALEELLIDGTSITKIDFPSMEQLRILSARQCNRLAHISDSICCLESLSFLGLDGAAIKCLPDSIGSLKKLRILLLGNCRKLAKLPDSMGNLKSLEVMDLSSTMITRLPGSVKNLEKLKVLKMENTHLCEFPKDIKNLEKLEEIDLSECKLLEGPICCDMKGLSSLKILRLSSTKISGLHWSDDGSSDNQMLLLLSHLQLLDLSNCHEVRDLPILPSNLSSLRWGSEEMTTVPDLSYLKNLKELYLGDITDPTQISASEPPQIGWLTSLTNLRILELCLSKITGLPENFSALQLRKLVLRYADLPDLQELPSSLSTLCLQHCKIQVPQFSTVRGLFKLELEHCDLAKISLEDLNLLQLLKISHCSVRTLDGLENMPHLRKLTLLHCPSLHEWPDPTKYNFEIDMCNY